MSRPLAILITAAALFATACEKKAEPTAYTDDTTTGDAYTSLDTTSTTPPATATPTPSYTSGTSYNSTYTSPAPAYTATPTDSSYTASPSYTSASTAEPIPAPSNSDELLAPETGGGSTYVVKRGDTLSKISRTQYGTDKRWRDIYKANKARISNPNKLKIGTKLIIP